MFLKSILTILFVALIVTKGNAFVTKVDSITYGKFGKVMLYQKAKVPTAVVLFISGDGGWGLGVINMAKYMAMQGALVLGIDAKTYNQSLSKQNIDCYDVATDFINLSNFIQQKYHFLNHVKPILIGYSYGATLVYGLMAQAKPNTFTGVIALGFCPDIEMKKPLCKGSGIEETVLKKGQSFNMSRFNGFLDPFIAINGVKDKTCLIQPTRIFLKGLKNVEFIVMKNLGHGFSIADNWLPQFRYQYKKIFYFTSPYKLVFY